jgi:hypothetical protein
MSPSGNGAISFPDYERVEKQVVSLLSVVPLKIGKITVNRGKRTGKRRLFAKSQHLTGRILLRTGTNTQEGDYPFSRQRLTWRQHDRDLEGRHHAQF